MEESVAPRVKAGRARCGVDAVAHQLELELPAHGPREGGELARHFGGVVHLAGGLGNRFASRGAGVEEISRWIGIAGLCWAGGERVERAVDDVARAAVFERSDVEVHAHAGPMERIAYLCQGRRQRPMVMAVAVGDDAVDT